MSDLYPDPKWNNVHTPYPCEHISLCIDPAYHDQYHHHQYGDNHTDMPSGTCSCCCKKDNDNNGDNSGNTDISAEYNGLPRYDHPHPHPCNHDCFHKYHRVLLRDEEVGNIIRVESRIIESLLIKLYSCIENKDVFVKMELGSKYSIKWIGPDGVNECTGILVDFKASQHSTIYQPFNADGYYLVMDCSTEGKSDTKKILISMIRDIICIDDSIDTSATIINNLMQDLDKQQQLIEDLRNKLKELKPEEKKDESTEDDNKDSTDESSKDNKEGEDTEVKEDPSSSSTTEDTTETNPDTNTETDK